MSKRGSRDAQIHHCCPQTAVLFVRPRGWHLLEKHMAVDGVPVPAAIFDFALFFFHNAKELLKRGSGPYFYLPKMQVRLGFGCRGGIFNFPELVKLWMQASASCQALVIREDPLAVGVFPGWRLCAMWRAPI